MKMEVAREGQKFEDGRVINPGALFYNGDFVPVTLAEDLDEIVGAARDLQRGDDGLVNMDVSLFEFAQDRIDLKLRDATVFISPFEFSGPEGQMEVTKGRIREIVLTRRENANPSED